MAHNPLTINPNDRGKLSLEFSKESLSEFVFSLLATPRQEQRVFKGGFDLTLKDLKILIDKITHKIKTDHDILHHDFKASITLDNNTQISMNSYDQLFSISEFRGDSINSVVVTLSVLIPFNRPDSEKSFEKQVIHVRAVSGRVGKIVAEIRSTEITWPEGYFSIIKSEFSRMSSEVSRSSSKSLNKFFFLTPFLIDDDDHDDDLDYKSVYMYNLSSRKSRVLLLLAALIFMIFSFSFLTASVEQKLENERLSIIYNPDTQLVESADTVDLIKNFGWQKAASMLRDARVVSEMEGVVFAEGAGPRSAITVLYDRYFNKYAIALFAIISLVFFGNLTYSSVLDSERIGRIFIFSEKIPPRPSGKLIGSIFVSLFFGVLGSVVGSIIMTIASFN